MPSIVPKANLATQKFSDTDLSPYCQDVHDGLAAQVVAFPTPPITLVAFQTLIDNYDASLVLATGPGAGKINTANKNKQKKILINALRVLNSYVNQVVYLNISSGSPYETERALIIATGFEENKIPTPAGPLPAPTLRKIVSPQKGQIKINLNKVINAKGYVVKVFDQNLDKYIGEFSFPGVNILFEGLTSAHVYSFQIATIGANPTRTFGLVIPDVVVI